MKKILFFTTAALLIVAASCGQLKKNNRSATESIEQTSDATPFVRIKYNQPINGYNVEAIFMPEGVAFDFGDFLKIIGSAKLTFTHQDTHKKNEITSAHFALPWQHFPDVFENEEKFRAMVDEGEIESFAKGQTYNLDYKFFETPGITDEEWITSHPLYYGELPFFFADVNFDGKNELILTKYREGQRGSNSYIVYSINPDGAFDEVIELPFDRLDDFSTIDSENKQIIIQNSNGANDSFEEVYKQDQSGKFYLAKTQ